MTTLFIKQAEPARERPAMTPSRRRRLVFSYAPDWIITIVLAAIFFSLDKVDGFRREFSFSDTSIRHKFAVHERVPNLGLYLICFVAPVLLQPVINLLTIRSWWDLHNGTLGLILSLAITGSITQFTKITVGRPRPDFIDRCQPPTGSADPTFGLSTVAICTQTDPAIIRDGFRSFFSGHSSLSFAGLGFLSYYLAGKLHLFDKRGHAGKAWLALMPFSGAALVAISRTMDYRHHWQDVLVGGLVGTICAYFSYRQYYPSFASELCHRPYSPRIKRDEQDLLPLHSNHDNKVQPPYNNPFAAPHPPIGGNSYTDGGRNLDQDYELEGTVPRPESRPLEEVWHDGNGVAPAPRALRPNPRSGSPTVGPSTDRQNTIV